MKKSYFVDSNIILGYLLRQYPNIDVFVQSQGNRFFYTETVRKELETKQTLLRHYEDVGKHFNFTDSCLTAKTKKESLNLFHSTWLKNFERVKNRDLLGFELTEEQLNFYRNGLFMIMEASVARYSIDDEEATQFLTTNQLFYRKFMIREKPKQILESTLNFIGTERLIQMVTLDDVLSKSLGV
jgi:hypothetical protein